MTISATTPRSSIAFNSTNIGGMMKAFALAVKVTVVGAIVVPVVRMIGLDVVVNGLSRFFQIALFVLTHAKWNELFSLTSGTVDNTTSAFVPNISISGIDPFIGLALLGFFAMAVLFGVVAFSARMNEA